MKIADIRKLSTEELNKKLKEYKSELMNLRFQNATKQLDNPQRIVEVKKTIAKILTVLREEELKKA
ncbi:MAG: 50S ribosomal protein L29 [Clostridia bacterium]|nr:50S ribosomal protein L29 [Clostridia bacterium]